MARQGPVDRAISSGVPGANSVEALHMAKDVYDLISTWRARNHHGFEKGVEARVACTSLT